MLSLMYFALCEPVWWVLEHVSCVSITFYYKFYVHVIVLYFTWLQDKCGLWDNKVEVRKEC